jgi:predicted RNA-binding Zn-ribbon protein involved in translation (DUF1610 family)
MVKYCSTCGAPIVNDQARFCDKCGAPLLVRPANEGNERDFKPQPKVTRIETEKKYSHIPLVADEPKPTVVSHTDKISFNNPDPVPKRAGLATKQIQETRCTCLACGKIWYYGKSDVYASYAAKSRNIARSLSCCSPVSLFRREKTDLTKCPNCGSKAVKKEQIIHEVE